MGVEIQKPHSTKMKLWLDTGERKPTKEFYTFP